MISEYTIAIPHHLYAGDIQLCVLWIKRLNYSTEQFTIISGFCPVLDVDEQIETEPRQNKITPH